MPKMPQMDLIAELKKRQKPRVREGKDGALEDIITGESHGASPELILNQFSTVYGNKLLINCTVYNIVDFFPPLRYEEHAVQTN